MKVIYKYPILTRKEIVSMPAGAKVISCINQHNTVTLYALVDNERPMVEREVYCIGTGHETPKDFEDKLLNKCDFVSTVPISDGSLIWHVFVEKERNYD